MEGSVSQRLGDSAWPRAMGSMVLATVPPTDHSSASTVAVTMSRSGGAQTQGFRFYNWGQGFSVPKRGCSPYA
jgi:hypothetical protein